MAWFLTACKLWQFFGIVLHGDFNLVRERDDSDFVCACVCGTSIVEGSYCVRVLKIEDYSSSSWTLEDQLISFDIFFFKYAGAF